MWEIRLHQLQQAPSSPTSLRVSFLQLETTVRGDCKSCIPLRATADPDLCLTLCKSRTSTRILWKLNQMGKCLFCAYFFFPVLSPARQNDRLLQLASFLRMPLSAKTGIVCSIPLFPSATSLLLAGSASAAMCCSLLQQSCTHRLGRRTKLKKELGTI